MDSILPMAPPAKSPLARYRLLSPSASIRVSPLCLGTMNFGNAWSGFMGQCDQNNTEKILDFFFDQDHDETDARHFCIAAGTNMSSGNFLDTANNYQFEESEKWIGEWMKKRGNRDQMVIATKYTTNFKCGPNSPNILANFGGNGTKSLVTSVNASLEKLQTDYIDLLYVHWWDFSTSIPELMQSLNQLVQSGKVLYLGISDAPAWVVSKANEYARNHGLRQFCVYQGRWSAAERDFERDIIPMCKSEGMGLCPWGALGGGKFKTEAQRQSTEGRKVDISEADIKTSQALEAVGKRKKASITSIAIAYVMHKTPFVFPLVGGRKLEHLKSNIEALTIPLDQDDIKEIESAAPFDLGFPHNFLWLDGDALSSKGVWLHGMSGTFDHVPQPKVITPQQGGK